MKIDAVRLDVTECHRNSVGLAEVQVFEGKKNLAEGMPASASDTLKATQLNSLTDGNTNDVGDGEGYWLSAHKTAWVEISLDTASQSKLVPKRP